LAQKLNQLAAFIDLSCEIFVILAISFNLSRNQVNSQAKITQEKKFRGGQLESKAFFVLPRL